MDFISENIRYSLWRRDIPKHKWVEALTSLVNQCSTSENTEWHSVTELNRSRANQIIDGAPVSDSELSMICEALGLDPQLMYLRLSVEVEYGVLAQNIRYLTDGLIHGEKRKLSDYLGVHPTTLSRWISGIQKPEKLMVHRLSLWFGLKTGELNNETPLFLELSAISAQERRQWLKNAVDEMDANSIAELFPALKRLLS